MMEDRLEALVNITDLVKSKGNISFKEGVEISLLALRSLPVQDQKGESTIELFFEFDLEREDLDTVRIEMDSLIDWDVLPSIHKDPIQWDRVAKLVEKGVSPDYAYLKIALSEIVNNKLWDFEVNLPDSGEKLEFLITFHKKRRSGSFATSGTSSPDALDSFIIFESDPLDELRASQVGSS